MSRKRAAPEKLESERKLKRGEENISDTEDALRFLKNKFFNELKQSFPPVYFVHQVYAIIKNKTKVDREIAKLQTDAKIILFRLRGDEDETAVIAAFTDDITSHLLAHSSSRTVKNFVDNVLPLIRNVYIDKETLKNKYSVSEANLNELVQHNVLVIRDTGSFWLSFPRAGEFTTAYNWGRRCLLRIIAKSKYSEILEAELAQRKLPKKALLDVQYFIYDLVGSEAVKCIPTTSGLLLRLVPR